MVAQTELTALAQATAKDRLKSLMTVFVEDSRFPRVFQAVFIAQASAFIDKLSEADVLALCRQLRDIVLPWLLGDDKNQVQ